MVTVHKCGSHIKYPPTGEELWCNEDPGHKGRHWCGNVSWVDDGAATAKDFTPPTIKLEPSQRGFVRGDFTDIYGQKCSIQKSSLATKDAIWLGVDVGFKPESLKSSPAESEGPTFPVGARMHLDQQKVRDLLPLLTKFAETGEI